MSQYAIYRKEDGYIDRYVMCDPAVLELNIKPGEAAIEVWFPCNDSMGYYVDFDPNPIVKKKPGYE